MTEKQKEQREQAKAYARNVIENDFGQKIDDETLESVTSKILRVLPKESKNTGSLEYV